MGHERKSCCDANCLCNLDVGTLKISDDVAAIVRANDISTLADLEEYEGDHPHLEGIEGLDDCEYTALKTAWGDFWAIRRLKGPDA